MPFGRLHRRVTTSALLDDESEKSPQTRQTKPGLLKRLSKHSIDDDSVDIINSPLSRANTTPVSSAKKSTVVVSSTKPLSVPSSTKSSAPPSRSNSKPVIPSFGSHTSPKTQTKTKGTKIDADVAKNGLARRDVRILFYGAPHFMLEKGRHGRFFPQILYPWNNQLEIADLWDRRPLRHESFAIATLHAHLPIPDEANYLRGIFQPIERGTSWKTYEIGIFEIPNMLGFEGREVGTIGMRHFLELPVADELIPSDEEASKEHQKQGPPNELLNMCFTEALKAMSQDGTAVSVGKHAPRIDRYELIREGPKGWKRLGLRDISMETIVNRLTDISKVHDKLVGAGPKACSLDTWSSAQLHQDLFTNILYLSTKPETLTKCTLKLQIGALIKILATRGAWIDFSRVEWRIKIGQILWQQHSRGFERLDHAAETKWLLIQILLSIELMIRLDAVIKTGTTSTSSEVHVSAEDIHQYNSLRNRKTDWDLIIARRFLDYFKFESAANLFGDQDSRTSDEQSSGHRHRFFRTFSSSRSNLSDSPWNLCLIPRRANIQAEGLLRFAQGISWPNLEELEAALPKKIACDVENAGNVSRSSSQSFPGTPLESQSGSPVSSPSRSSLSPTKTQGKNREGNSWTRGSKAVLQKASPTTIGSWLSRSWFTGLVLPGHAISHILMATLLENDPGQALDKIGDEANLWGGFVLDSRSYWSKFCIVSRVFGSLEDSAECMGWVSLPKVTPVFENNKQHPNGWLGITTRDIPHNREGPRLFDGPKLAHESSVLGLGQGTVSSKEFCIPGRIPRINGSQTHVDFAALRLHRHPELASGEYLASVDFNWREQGGDNTPLKKTLCLRYNVQFVCAQPCRLPPGHSALVSATHGSTYSPLPSHPLHMSYHYKVVNPSELPIDGQKAGQKTKDPDTILVIDARCSREKDAFARAWCAHIGRNALIAREGRVCISCCVREAKALAIETIILIGGAVDATGS